MPKFTDVSAFRYGVQTVSKIMVGTTQVWPIINNLNLYKFSHQVDSYVTSYPELSKIANQPQSFWIGDWDNSPDVTIGAHRSAANGKTLHYVLYAIPFRDNGNFSAGGFQTDQEYFSWIDRVVIGIGNSEAIIILEPDALGLISNLDSAAQSRRYNLLSTAVTKLKQGTNTKVFLDMGLWIEPTDAATRFQNANINSADGYSVNVSNYETTAYCHTRSADYKTSLANIGISNKKYVIDTSRNGNGPLLSNYPSSAPWFNTNQTWCNPPGRALGITPSIPTSFPDCYALLWIKSIGESDGNFPSASQNAIFTTDAPSAGNFWIEYARQIANNSP